MAVSKLVKILIGAAASSSALSVGTFFTIQQTISGGGVKTSKEQVVEPVLAQLPTVTTQAKRIRVRPPKRECEVILKEIRDKTHKRTKVIEDSSVSKWSLKDFLSLKDVEKQDKKWVVGYNKRVTFAELRDKLNSRCDEMQGKGKIFVGNKFSFYYYLENQAKYSNS